MRLGWPLGCWNYTLHPKPSWTYCQKHNHQPEWLRWMLHFFWVIWNHIVDLKMSCISLQACSDDDAVDSVWWRVLANLIIEVVQQWLSRFWSVRLTEVGWCQFRFCIMFGEKVSNEHKQDHGSELFLSITVRALVKPCVLQWKQYVHMWQLGFVYEA